jgi:hypothetical protein
MYRTVLWQYMHVNIQMKYSHTIYIKHLLQYKCIMGDWSICQCHDHRLPLLGNCYKFSISYILICIFNIFEERKTKKILGPPYHTWNAHYSTIHIFRLETRTSSICLCSWNISRVLCTPQGNTVVILNTDMTDRWEDSPDEGVNICKPSIKGQNDIVASNSYIQRLH